VGDLVHQRFRLNIHRPQLEKPAKKSDIEHTLKIAGLEIINFNQTAMRKMPLLIVLLAAASYALASPTRIEVGRPTTAAEDTKPNSEAVPEAYAIAGQFERTVVLRFKNKADLLPSLERMVKEQGIRNGVILAGIGSVNSYHYHMVSNTTFPSKNIFIKDPEAPADIVSMNGYTVEGKVHVHIMFADADKAFGGHLEPGTSVFTFAAVTIGVFKDGFDLRRVDDKNYR
jgi:predicted DNA-binding protein with PD1-like motif